MATVEKTIFTNLAQSFINDINRGNNGLSSMNTVYSSSDLSGMSDDDIQNLTDIQSKDITAKCDIIKLEDGSTKVRSVCHNDKLTQGIYIRSYATYATDNNGKQFLYAVKINTKPQYLAAYDGINSNSQSYGFTVKYDRTDKISFTQLSNLAVTYDEFNSAMDSKADNSAISSLESDIGSVSSAVANNSVIAQSFSAVNSSISANSSAIAVNSSNIVTLNSNIGNAYQNAVTTAKSYTDNANPYTMTANESEAIRQANAAVRPGLFLYPTDDDKSKITIAKHVLAIYSYGVGNLPTIALDITNLDTSKFTFNSVYAVYNPNIRQFTLHGSITAKNVSGNTNMFSLNISGYSMNDIASSSLNNQPFTIDTDYNRQNIIATASGNGTINLDGCVINIKYDGTLKDKLPFTMPSGYSLVILKDSDSLSDFTKVNNTIYYALQDNSVKKSPTKNAFIMALVPDANKYGINVYDLKTKNKWWATGNTINYTNPAWFANAFINPSSLPSIFNN